MECGIAITASSLATLRPLFVKLTILASNHFTSQFTSIKGGTPVLPMFSNNQTTTLISSSRRHNTQDTNRNTSMTGTTAASGGYGITHLREKTDGIQVEREFEMSVVSREGSQDSIDRLEAEVNEVIRPGTAKLKASRDRQQHGSIRSSSKSSLAPIQTSFWDATTIAPSTVSAGSSMSSAGGAWPLDTPAQTRAVTHSPRSVASTGKSSFRQSQRRTHGSVSATFGGGGVGFSHTEGGVLQTPPPPRFRHVSTSSDASLPAPGTPLSPAPGFHLPRRRENQSIASTASGASSPAPSRSRGTFGSEDGLPAPPGVKQYTHGEYMSDVNSDFANSPTGLGNPPVTPKLGSPASRVRFPHHKPGVIQEGREEKRRKRSNGYPASGSLAPATGAGDESDEELTGSQTSPVDDGETPSPVSPLRSHPPISPKGNWL